MAVASALLVLLAGCREAPDLGGTGGAAGTVGTPTGTREHYVALGDSYTAAPFTGDQGSDDGCFRSNGNYPHLVAKEVGLALSDVSCSGATTDALDSRQVTFDGGRRPPQLKALAEDTDLVTVSIGANDFDLFGTLIHQCVALADQDPRGAPCTEADRVDGESIAQSRVDRIRTRVRTSLREITDRAPDARVLLVGYPQLAPAEGSCEQLPIAEGDYPFARRLNEQVNRALADAARAAEAEFVDVFAATEGHDMCAADPWIAGTEPVADAAPFHPYPEEQQAVADLILERLED